MSGDNSQLRTGYILAVKTETNLQQINPVFVPQEQYAVEMKKALFGVQSQKKKGHKLMTYYAEAVPAGKSPNVQKWLFDLDRRTEGMEDNVFLLEIASDNHVVKSTQFRRINGEWIQKDEWHIEDLHRTISNRQFQQYDHDLETRIKNSTRLVRNARKEARDTDRIKPPPELVQNMEKQGIKLTYPVPESQDISGRDLDFEMLGIPQGFNEEPTLSPLRSGMSKETERIPSLNPENDPSQSAPPLKPEPNTLYVERSSMEHVNQLNNKPSDTERMLPVADDASQMSAEEFELSPDTDTKSDTRTDSGRREIVDDEEEVLFDETGDWGDIEQVTREGGKITHIRKMNRQTEKLPEPIAIAPDAESEVVANFSHEEEDPTTVAPEEVHPYRTQTSESAPVGIVDKSPSDVDVSDLAPPIPDNARDYFATREEISAPSSGNTVQIPLSDIVERPDPESDRTGKILKKEDVLGKKEKSQRINAVPEVKKPETPAISPETAPAFATPALGVPADEFGGSDDETSFSDVEDGNAPIEATPPAIVPIGAFKNAALQDKVSSQHSAPVSQPAQDDIDNLSREDLLKLVGEQQDYAAQLERDADRRLSEIQDAHKTIQSLRKEKSELEKKVEDVYVLDDGKSEDPDLRVLNKKVMAEQSREKILKDANAKLNDEIAELNEKISSLNEEKAKQDKDLHELRTTYDKTLVKLHNDRLEKMEMHFVKMNEDLSQKINKRRKRSLLKFAAGAVLGLGIGAAAVFNYFPRETMSSEEKSKYESTIASHEHSEKQLKDDNKSLADKLTNEQSAHNETKQSVQKGKEQLENDKKSFNDEKSEWEKNKDADLERRIKDKVAEFEKEKASMSDKMKEYESKVADLEKSVSTLTEAYNSFKKTAEETEAGYKAKASEYESEIESQKTELEKQKAELQSAKDRIHDLEKRAGVYKTKAVYDFDKALNDLGFGQPKVRLDISNILKNALVESPYEGSEIYRQFEQLFNESNGTTTYGVKSETRAEVAARLTLAAARFEKFNDTKKITDLYNTMMKDRPASVAYDDWAESTAEQVLFRMLQERK